MARRRPMRVDWWHCERCALVFVTKADPETEEGDTEECPRCDNNTCDLVAMNATTA